MQRGCRAPAVQRLRSLELQGWGSLVLQAQQAPTGTRALPVGTCALGLCQ